ncbi:MAG: sigma-70 family RNA polymerase sigma factor [Thermomicrobium sp.]|nr:sigma-70 family RNA polymerase sigma factor [Thermomicrobium sp.]
MHARPTGTRPGLRVLLFVPCLCLLFAGDPTEGTAVYCPLWSHPPPPSVSCPRRRRERQDSGDARPSPAHPPPEPVGEDELFASLYDQYGPRVRTSLLRLGVPETVRGDLLQETLARAWAARRQLRCQRALPQWRTRIAQRCWLDWLRARRIEYRVLTRALHEQCAETEDPWSPDRVLLAQALATLRDVDREILSLRREAERSFEEIAEFPGISPAAAQRRAHRALARLAQALARLEQDRERDRPTAGT